jgi:hypothetical protein
MFFSQLYAMRYDKLARRVALDLTAILRFSYLLYALFVRESMASKQCESIAALQYRIDEALFHSKQLFCFTII